MRYASMRSLDISNGENVGVSLFVQGCHFHCKNCFNKDTWDFNGGKEWNNSTLQEFIKLIDRDYIKRVTILGGEPLADENINDVLNIVLLIRKMFSDTKKIWLYTGYSYDDIKSLKHGSNDNIRLNIIYECDILVDGRYIDELRDMKLKWRGSSNQKVIDVKKSFKENRCVLYSD